MTTNDRSPLAVFQNGLTFSAYQASMTKYQQAMADHYAALQLPQDEAAALARVDVPLRVLVVTEDWCGDAVLNLPILMRLLEAMPAAEARIVRREDHWDLANRYPAADGHNHIPLFIFMEAGGRELGHWIERSAAAQAWDQAYRAQHPPPPRQTDSGERNPAWETWINRKLARARRAYQEGLWLAAVEEFKTLLL